ncbi:MAG: AAA family ATPase [Candidatus Pacebacteria bacterium]|nr:AAA family ATPase [Candidatus Paceibacterota bacterium]
MRLKALEIAGFKSFAKKSRLDFDTSITSIVGPNGSGKSNVAESFRFVLGEQSIKSMRGKKGEDLIFNGTTALGRQNKASVKIVLDNNDRTLDLDFDEVVLERVVHRDGVNDYLINGSSVRLKDISELLAGANIGSTGHNIISQGEADRILNSTPKERRSMLEDALGLRVFQYKKVESERRLQKTEENVAQVQSLRKEIAPHIKYLKKQVEKIEQTRELKDQLRITYRTYLAIEKKYIDVTKLYISNAKVEPKNKLEKIENDLVSSREELSKSKQTDTRTDDLSNLNNQLSGIRSERNNALREIGQFEGELKSLERIAEREKKEEQDVNVSLRDVENLKNTIDQISSDVENADISVLKNALNKIKDALSNFILERRKAPQETDLSLVKDIEDLKNKIIESQEKSKKLEEKEKALENIIFNLRQEIESSKTTMLDVERNIFEMETKKGQLMSELNRISIEESALIRVEEDFKRELTEAMVLVGREAVDYESEVLDEGVERNRDIQNEKRRNLEKMKIRIEELGGGISNEVLKEYEEVTERDEFLIKEITDLENSAVSLKQLISELDTEITKRFKEGVDLINKEFQKFFALMFGGGDAALKLVRPEVRRKKSDTDIDFDNNGVPDDLDQEEGIDIDISLPRKKVKGLMMLSGGERALTSIALIFAMSAVNPPPFIILDETDAALDESNSKKYADMIERLSDRSQLILITHNRETMSRASVIYGVTMMQGASELLSIKFDEGVQYAK